MSALFGYLFSMKSIPTSGISKYMHVSVGICTMTALCAVFSKERLRKPFRGTLTQSWFYSHSLFKWQGQGSHWARPWPTCWCRTGDIHHRLWGWQVHALCSNLALAVMGWVHIIRVHIVMNTAQRHCHSKCQCAKHHIPTHTYMIHPRYMQIHAHTYISYLDIFV